LGAAKKSKSCGHPQALKSGRNESLRMTVNEPEEYGSAAGVKDRSREKPHLQCKFLVGSHTCLMVRQNRPCRPLVNNQIAQLQVQAHWRREWVDEQPGNNISPV
jgi:hypothetical protein